MVAAAIRTSRSRASAIGGADAAEFSHDLATPVTLTPGASTTVTITHTAGATLGAKTATLTLTHDGDNNPTVTNVTANTTPPPPDPSGVVRVNAGGPAITDTPDWEADDPASVYVNAGSDIFDTGATIDMTDPSIPAGTPMALFQTERWDPEGGAEMTWDFPVTNGTYTVDLYFAEIYNGAFSIGARVFDVDINGTTVLDNYDTYADVGAETAVIKTFPVTVTNGTINIELGHVTENTAIKALQISPQGEPPVDTTPPTVTATTPTDTATDIAIGTNVTATFSEAMNPATLNPASFTLTEQGTGTPVTATISYNPGTNTATLDPDTNLTNNTTYTATITTTATDTADNPLTTNHTWTYTTDTTTTPPDPSNTGTTGEWTTRAPVPSGRAEVGVAAIGTDVYVVGGKNDDTGLLSDVAVFDHLTQTWSSAADLPGPARDHLGVVELGGKIYAVGGLIGWPGPSVTDVWVYDPATDVWTELAGLPTPRGAMGVTVHDGLI